MANYKGYRVTSGFGWRNHPITGKRSWHTGIDLVKSHKAPIEAFTDGIVVFAGMGKSGTGFGGYGNVVFLKDKNGRGQVYAHLDSVSVKKGQRVSKGQEVGKQGTTGQSTGSHLHFEVRKSAPSGVPYGWEADRVNNCLNPTDYIDNFKSVAELPSGILKRGDRGSKVKQMQEALANVYFYPEKGAPNNGVDGIYGPRTEDAVKRFQSVHVPSEVDGIYGPNTRKALKKLL